MKLSSGTLGVPRLTRLRRRAFTLLELLVVVVVIGILATLAIIRFGNAQEKAYVATMQSDLRNFATARAIHISENEALPGSAAGVSGYSFSDLVFEAGYTESSATEWGLLVGHNKTETRCVLSTMEAGAAHRIQCAAEASLGVTATASGSSVTVDATGPINSMAFAPDERTGAVWAASKEDIALVSWEWGDGTVSSGSPATHVTQTHSYAKAGTYTIQLTLVKKTGETARGTTAPVAISGGSTGGSTPSANRAPVAGFAWSPTAPVNGQAVTFTSTSTDADGDALTATWDVGGTAATGASTSATFPAAGDYVVKLTVSDGKGGTHSSTQTVKVAQANRAPEADFSWSPSLGQSGQSIAFQATATDADGDVLTYAWDFGSWTSTDGANVSYAFAIGGTYSVQLVVRDGRGGEKTVTKSVQVNSVPVANFTVTPNSPTTGSAATFTSTSTDGDSDPLSCTWNINGTAYTTCTASHTFSTAAVVQATLTVSDGRGGTHSQTQNVTVQQGVTSLYSSSNWAGWGISGATVIGSSIYLPAGAGSYAILNQGSTGHNSGGFKATAQKVTLSTTATEYSISATDPAGKTYTYKATLKAGVNNHGKKINLCMQLVSGGAIYVAWDTMGNSTACTPVSASDTVNDPIEVISHSLTSQ